MTYDTCVHAKAVDLTRLAVEMTTEAGSGHPSSAASLAHIVTVLLYDHLRFDPDRPASPSADRLVLSEGHACPILYAAGADLGIAIEDGEGQRRMTRADAMDLRRIGSHIDGHPNPAEGFPFFPAATGSLGQGLSVAAGIALGARMQALDKRVFCIIGDGESREGQIWEAVDFLVEHDLRAVLPIFNCNELGQTGRVSHQQDPDALARKLDAFGVEPEVIDGHDPSEILRCLKRHAGGQHLEEGRPIAIVARTVKGWGMPELQGDGHHGKPLQGESADQALRELQATARAIGASWTEGELVMQPVRPQRVPVHDRHPLPSLTQALIQTDRKAVLDQRKMATRKAFGLALRMLGHARTDIVALDGDVGNSTYTEDFEHDADLRDRFLQCRIAEQNMVSVAAGLCAEGMAPFVATFGKFLTRAYDQIEMALISGFPMKLVGSHVGVSLAADGPSQMALPDVAFFRAFATANARNGGGPLMYVLTPSDAFSAYALTERMASHAGACYLRTLRPSVPLLYDDDTRFELGGHRLVADGGDVLIAAWGYMVHEALAARDALAEQGISAAVADLYSVPFDDAAVARLARERGGKVVTVEDNYGGGLGAAVSEALIADGGSFVVEQMFVRRIPKSGRTPDAVLDYLGLSRTHIADAARRALKRAADG